MAIENKVILSGQISSLKCKVVEDLIQMKKFKSWRMRVRVYRRQLPDFDEEGTRLVRDNIAVYFRDAMMSWELETKNFKRHDMIEIYGMLTSTPGRWTCKCTQCGAVFKADRIITGVRPLFFRKMEPLSEYDIKDMAYDENDAYEDMDFEENGREDVEDEEVKKQKELDKKYFFAGKNLTEKRIELSNRIRVIGNLTADPNLFISNRGISICTYQIAVSRSIFVPEDPENIDTDFLWIRSIGENADKDYEMLRKGSLVYIEGSLQSKFDYEQLIKCPNCGNEYRQKNTTGTVEILAEKILRIRNLKEKEGIIDGEPS